MDEKRYIELKVGWRGSEGDSIGSGRVRVIDV